MTRRLFISLVFFAFATGCITPKAHENPKSTQELRTVLQDFHMKLRWGLWEQAAQYTTPTYRNEFLGRYEELGEDYKITNLNIKQVTLGDPISTVEVEQEWYVEPNMTVQKKRFVETWVTGGGTWRIDERITKEEFRKRKKEAAEAITADGDDDESESETTPTEEPEFEAEEGEWQ